MAHNRTLYSIIIIVTGLLSLILVATASWNFINADDERFRGKLDGDHEVPPVNSNGSAVAKFKVDNDTITYNINVTGISDATGATLHMGGKKDRDGPIIVNLLKAGEGSATPTGMIIKGNFSGLNLEGPMAGNTTSDVISVAAANKTYVTIQTNDHPDGEIRGQLKQWYLNKTAQ